MKKGSVIVDLAAENGGNCALTEPGTVVERYGVHILGYIDLPSRLAPTASLLLRQQPDAPARRSGRRQPLPSRSRRRSRARRAGACATASCIWPPPRREPPAALPPSRSCRGAGAAPRTPSRPKKQRGVGRPVVAIARARSRSSASAWSRRRRSCRTSRCSRSPASSAGRWSGTSRRRCTRRS